MKTDWSPVEVLRYARHDWLNKIQLIKGNLSLNKIDRANEIIDEIVSDAREEANLTNLNLPRFATLLLTYNWNNQRFQVDYEVLDVLKCEYIDDEGLAQWTDDFFACLNASIKPYYENHLTVTIDPQLTGTRFFFDFRGIITDIGQIEEFLSRDGFLAVVNQEISDYELSLEVFFSSK